MDRRTKICIWIILLGLTNFLVYVLLYVHFQGEAVNGQLDHYQATGETHYVLQSGHRVSRGVYIYSGIHSISIWPTVGAVMLAMLTLAKERIASSMRSAIVRGRTLITILATIITLIVMVMLIHFTLSFSESFLHPHVIPPEVPPPALTP